MTPAERLRAAAQLARKTAERATEDRYWTSYPLPDAGPNRHTMTGIGTDDEMGHRAEAMFPEDAAHIALWSPPVALAVASWLESAIPYFDVFERHGGGAPQGILPALAVADALLQTQQSADATPRDS